MIQQTLFQSYVYIRKRTLSLDKSTTERDLVNDVKVTNTLKEITHNSQKTNVNASWREVSGKKKLEQPRNINPS